MRPIMRGASPRLDDFDDYRKALPFLVSRLGGYCSYCERRIATNLAVEHIQPKGLALTAHLIGSWSNYLLACVNCNSTKASKAVALANTLLPDRDNTFIAFAYLPDGRIEPSAAAIAAGLGAVATTTLELTGLDKAISMAVDENGKQVAYDRVAQRLEVWAVAEEARTDIDNNPGLQALRRATIRTALGYGHFSIWMTVFEEDAVMRNLLIDAFNGTRNSGCFDSVTTLPLSPSPNLDNLPNGGKI